MTELTIAGITDVGTRRRSNQDTITWQLSNDRQRALAVVADGMGGHAGGDVASQLAVEVITDRLQPWLEGAKSNDRLWVLIQRAIDDANSRIRKTQAGDPTLGDMGTTLVVACVEAGLAHIAHIGDSRCYRFSRSRELTCQTRDDTVVQDMVDEGTITQADVPDMPFRSMLRRALGVSDDASATFTECRLEAGDQLLLCSDGLTDAIPEADWPDILGRDKTPEKRVQTLLDTSLANQAADNVSLIIIQWE